MSNSHWLKDSLPTSDYWFIGRPAIIYSNVWGFQEYDYFSSTIHLELAHTRQLSKSRCHPNLQQQEENTWLRIELTTISALPNIAIFQVPYSCIRVIKPRCHIPVAVPIANHRYAIRSRDFKSEIQVGCCLEYCYFVIAIDGLVDHKLLSSKSHCHPNPRQQVYRDTNHN